MFCPVSCPFPDNEVHPPHTFRASWINYTFAPVCHYKIYRASAISARFFAQNRREGWNCRNWAEEPRRPESYGLARAGISKEGRKGGNEDGILDFELVGGGVGRLSGRVVEGAEKSAPSLPRGLRRGAAPWGHAALPPSYSSYLVSNN